MKKPRLSLSLEVVDGPMSVRGLYVDNAVGVLHPHAVLDTASNTALLYYTPYPPEESELPYLALSKDLRNFEMYSQEPLFGRGEEGSWDSHHLADVDVVRAKRGRWLMYFAGASMEGGVKRVSIGLATSSNGLEWDKEGEPVITSQTMGLREKGYTSVATPSVVVVNGVYYMFFEASRPNGESDLLLAESDDGVEFRNPKILIRSGKERGYKMINHPHASIIAPGDEVLLLFLTYDGKCFKLNYAILEELTEPPPISPKLLMGGCSACCTLLSKEIFRKIAYSNRFIYWNFSRLITKKNTNIIKYLPKYHIYRSSLLTDPERFLWKENDGTVYLYISAYDAAFLVPDILLYKLKVRINEA